MHRILYVIDTLEVGGSERSLVEIVTRLDRTCFEPVVCSLYQGAALRPELEAAGVRVVACELPGKYQFAQACRTLRGVVRDVNPDVIHTTLFRANQVGRVVAWWLGFPVISSLVSQPYSPARFQSDPNIVPWKLRCLQMLDRTTARLVTRFHAVSRTVREGAASQLRIAPERALIIPRGREIDRFPPRSCPAALKLREELCGTAAGPIVLNVGRLIAAKGQCHLIAAMNGVLREFPDARLMIAGEGSLRGELEELIAERKLQQHVRLLGQRNDVELLLSFADVFVFPSLHEGLPGAAVEAMLAGCPVVASDIAVMREVLEPGVSGFLAPPGDVPALTGSILRALRDRGFAEHMAAEAQSEARARFDIQHVVAQTQWLYDSVLTGTLSRSKANPPTKTVR